jgi:hypothetical protein
MYRTSVTSEEVLRNLVRGCIESRDHPVIEERDEAVADVALALEDFVRASLSTGGAWDSRFLSLDGLKPARVEYEGNTRLRIVGAFYLLDEHGHQMLPIEAELSISPGDVSTVKVAGSGSVFDMPQSERQFTAGIDNAEWEHHVQLVLA